jgi:hypothetical protein
MREARVKCLSAAGFHHMAYVEWGDPANPGCWSACMA